MLNFIKKKPIAVFLFTAIIIIGSAALYNAWISNNQDKNAINFTLKDLNGKTVSSSDIKEQKIIINYWATWCAPCREEIPALNEAWSQLKDDNIEMIAINFGEDKQTITDFLKKFPIDFTVLMDEDNMASSKMQITAMPTTLILNKDGVVLDKILGPREWNTPEVLKYIREL